MIELAWPGDLPDLSELPALRVRVTQPRDQSALHRELARLGYVCELDGLEGDAYEHYTFVHPDGEQL